MYVYFISLGTQYNMGEAVSCPPTSRLTHSTGTCRTTFPMSLTARCGLVANWNRQWCIQFPDHILEREGCPSSCTQNTDRLGLSQHPRNSTTTRKKESGSLSDLKEQSCLPLTTPKACFVWSLSWLMRTALSEREMVVSEQWTWVEVSYVLDEEKNAQLGWA